MWKLIAACLALGGLSLLVPSEPSYDPLAWLIWGRELAHFHLDTNGGPSWKPLLQTRLAWELGVPMELTESLTGYRVVFRSSRELLVGRVYMTGRARSRRTLARVGSFRVYRRDGLTFPVARREWKINPPFTQPLQGINTRVRSGRIPAPRVVTR